MATEPKSVQALDLSRGPGKPPVRLRQFTTDPIYERTAFGIRHVEPIAARIGIALIHAAEPRRHHSRPQGFRFRAGPLGARARQRPRDDEHCPCEDPDSDPDLVHNNPYPGWGIGAPELEPSKFLR